MQLGPILFSVFSCILNISEPLASLLTHERYYSREEFSNIRMASISGLFMVLKFMSKQTAITYHGVVIHLMLKYVVEAKHLFMLYCNDQIVCSQNNESNQVKKNNNFGK